MRGSWSLMRVVFAAALLLAVAVNASSAVHVETQGVARRLQAWDRVDDPSFVSLMFTTSKVSTRMGPYYALSQIAPGSTVTLTDIPVVAPRRLALRFYGLGEAAEVVFSPQQDTMEIVQVDVMPHIVASGPSNDGGPAWFIAIAPGAPAVGDREDPDGYVRSRLQGGSPHVPGPAREFIALSWPKMRPDTTLSEEWGFQLALIDMALLEELGVEA